MKLITILDILAECKGKPVTSRYILEALVKMPEMATSKAVYASFGWDETKITDEVIRDNSRDLNVLLQCMKKSGFIKLKPIKKCDKKIGSTDMKMLYTLSKLGKKERRKIKTKKST